MNGGGTPGLPAAGTPAVPVRDPEGVDLTLIRWMLSLTPAERLDVLQDTVEAIEDLRRVAAAD